MTEPVLFLVNDDRDAGDLMGRQLERRGYRRVVVLGSARQALARLPEDRPDLILSDVNMAEVDGFQLCRILKSPAYGAYHDIPVLLFSGSYRDSRASDLARECGAFAFLQVPYDEEELMELIESKLSGGGALLLKRGRVLVVEDDEEQGHTAQRALEESGFHVELAGDAIAAQSLLASVRFDLVLLDYHLPVVDGLALLRWIRSQSVQLPVVMMTKEDGTQIGLRLLNEGAEDFIKSPLQREELLLVCERTLKRRDFKEARARHESSEQRLRASEIRYRSLFENARDAIFVCDQGGRVLEVNRSGLELLGEPRESLVGARLDDYYVAAEQLAERRERLGRDGYVQDLEVSLRHSDGSLRVAKETGSLVYGEEGELLHYEVILRDVTTTQKRERELASINRQLEELGAIAANTFSSADPSTVFKRISSAVAEISDFQRVGIFVVDEGPDGRRGWTCLGQNGEGGAVSLPPALDDILEQGRCLGRCSYYLQSGEPAGRSRAGGRWAPGDCLLVLLRDHRSGMGGVLKLEGSRSGEAPNPRSVRPLEIFASLISALRHSHLLAESVAVQGSFLENLIQSSADGVLACDGALRVTLANPAAASMLGADGESLTARHLAEILGAELAERLAWLGVNPQAGAMDGLELTREHQGAARELSVSASVWRAPAEGERISEGRPGLLLNLRDVTGERRLQRQLAQAQKLDSIGALAAGMAHDFNNILAAILPNAELIKALAEPGSVVHRRAEATEAAARRGSELTRRLLAFSRPQAKAVESIDLNASAHATVALLTETLDKKIRIQTSLGPDVAPVTGDRGQIEHVLLNLAINARDAMEEGGTLTFETAALPMDHAFLMRRGRRGTPFSRISVIDTGCGMPPEIVEKIFDPFFSTKKEGKGTGLGLSIAYATVKSLGGMLEVESRPGRGSRFDIYLPASGAATVVAPRESPMVSGKGERILVVEDEPGLRELVVEMLGGLNYDVVAVSSGGDAVDYVARSAPDLVLLDMVMPEMDGWDTYCRLKAVHPGMRFLLTSGDCEDPRAVNMREQGVSVLQKPFSWNSLSAEVRSVLRGATPAPVVDAGGKAPPSVLAVGAGAPPPGERGLERSAGRSAPG